MIRTAVVDENEIFRRGLVACLREDGDIYVVEERAIGSERVDVAVVSRTALAELASIQCPLVLCTSAPHAPDDERILAVLPRGSLTRDQLVAAVRGAAAGLKVSRHGFTLPLLDERSLGILRLLADGADTQEISRQLRYSQSTIKGLIASIEAELESRNRTQAVATAIRRGLI